MSTANVNLIITIFFFGIIIFIIKIVIQSKKRSKSQLEVVTGETFTVQPLLNREETIVYNALIKNIVIPTRNKIRVYPQISLGEILKHKERNVYMKINSKRVDFCITNSVFEPIAVIEYNGGGHYKSNYKERDAVKQTAIESAGMTYHVITENNLKNIDNHINNSIVPLIGIN